MKNLLHFFKINSSIIITIVIFGFISIFNSFMNIGLIEDGIHHFIEGIIAKNIWLGHEYFRYFPTILSHLSVGIPMMFGIRDTKTLLFVFTFISYFQLIFMLFVAYINIPKNKKDYFEFVLLYFVSCMMFFIYYVWAESLMTGLFLWVIFIVYYCVDFQKLTKINLISLIMFSICCVSSHTITSMFVLPMIIFAIIKQCRTKNIPNISKIVLILSYILLSCAFVYNLYYAFAIPNDNKFDYFSQAFFNRIEIKTYLCSLMLIFVISIINNKKLKYFNLFLFSVSTILLSYVFLNNIDSASGFVNRIMGLYIPFIIMMFILIKDFFKLQISYKYIKIINIIIMLIFLIHTINYGYKWNDYLLYINDYANNNSTVTVSQIRRKFHVFHSPMTFFLYVLALDLYNNKSKCKLLSFFEVDNIIVKPNQNIEQDRKGRYIQKKIIRQISSRIKIDGIKINRSEQIILL